MTRWLIAFLCMIGLSLPVTLMANRAEDRAVVIGNVAPRYLAPLVEELNDLNLGFSVTYRQLPTEQVMTSVLSQPRHGGADLVILSSPDLAVQAANEGFAQRYEPSSAPPFFARWRNEVFTIALDPAVMVLRRGLLPDDEIPRSRLELAQLLENGIGRYDHRTGVLNIGVEPLAYFFSSQESLRSPLFWRLARALGKTRARIYNQYPDLLDDIAAGKIDLAYNIPLSETRDLARAEDALIVIEPRDFMLVSQWSAVIPRSGDTYRGQTVLDFILSQHGQDLLWQAGVGFQPGTEPPSLSSESLEVSIGPQLLVFLDPLKRSRFLDSWIQLVADL